MPYSLFAYWPIQPNLPTEPYVIDSRIYYRPYGILP